MERRLRAAPVTTLAFQSEHTIESQPDLAIGCLPDSEGWIQSTIADFYVEMGDRTGSRVSIAGAGNPFRQKYISSALAFVWRPEKP